jgi:Zn-dependent protease with chaperone function
MQIQVSANFKKMTIKAILSIVLFIAVYLILLLLAIGLTFLCGIFGIAIISSKPSFLTLMLGLGLLSIGILILIFLLKFLFKKHVIDRSHLIEISKKQEPELFEFIAKIVKEINTDFPKKIYVSADVNASVFYDSSFWSMFFPIKKNLQIGLGLVNTVSQNEFKAILAHEFGHFSQRTMRVGTYVYNVNKIIFNMLYDNESYAALAQKWANVNSYLTLFVSAAFKITQGIQGVLRKVYEIVNLSYMGLSREMEFHADEVAANVAGSKPLITSLLRMNLADSSYNTILNFYNNKITDCKKTQNIYIQQQFVLNFIANEHELPIEDNLPLVTTEYLSRYNKSKFNATDQWASHPSTEDRVKALNKLNINKNNSENAYASSLFSDMNTLQKRTTEQLFSTVTYNNTISNIEDNDFIEEFTTEYKKNSFSNLFNNYYDNKSPSRLELENIENSTNGINFNELFDNRAVDWVYTSISLESDINILNQVANKNYKIKSFDYDGNKYSQKDSTYLIPKLEKQLQEIKEKIKDNDQNIYTYFLSLASKSNKEKDLKLRYQAFLTIDKENETKFDIYIKLMNASNFINHTNTFDIIEQNIITLKDVETSFKKHVKDMLEMEIFQSELTSDMKESFLKYISEDWTYFYRPKYDDDTLNILFSALNNFHILLSKSYFKVKKDLLNYFEELKESHIQLPHN